jgi:hypothetical protein
VYGISEPLRREEQVALLVHDGGTTERGEHHRNHSEEE